jgi:hypothetical protein
MCARKVRATVHGVHITHARTLYEDVPGGNSVGSWTVSSSSTATCDIRSVDVQSVLPLCKVLLLRCEKGNWWVSANNDIENLWRRAT